MEITLDLAAAIQNTKIPEGSGNVKALGVGLAFLFIGWFMAKHKFLLYGDWLEGKLSEVKFDWKSLMSFLLGFAGVTVVLGAPRQGMGIFSTIIDAPQAFFAWIGETGVGAAVGMWFFCLIIFVYTLKKAMKDKDDCISDIRWGGICAFAFPMGGWPFAWVSMTVANAVVELMNGIPSEVG